MFTDASSFCITIDDSLNRWLVPLVTLARTPEIQRLQPPDIAIAALTELNIRTQMGNVRATVAGKKVEVHGWIYDLATGILSDLDAPRRLKK